MSEAAKLLSEWQAAKLARRETWDAFMLARSGSPMEEKAQAQFNLAVELSTNIEVRMLAFQTGHEPEADCREAADRLSGLLATEQIRANTLAEEVAVLREFKAKVEARVRDGEHLDEIGEDLMDLLREYDR